MRRYMEPAEEAVGLWGCSLAEDAALSGQDVIHFSFLFRFEEDIEEDGNRGEEAGGSHQRYNQPCKGGVCEKRRTQVNKRRDGWQVNSLKCSDLLIF